jgi:RHS repeat-associated protein
LNEERRSYDAFGARRNPVWGAPNPASFSSKAKPGFTGHEGDDELGLVNMKGRIYDPKVGRFLTPDPIVSMPHFGQSWNPYSYVLNSPLAYVDPSGFSVVVAEEAPPTSLGEGEAWPPVAGSIRLGRVQGGRRPRGAEFHQPIVPHRQGRGGHIPRDRAGRLPSGRRERGDHRNTGSHQRPRRSRRGGGSDGGRCACRGGRKRHDNRDHRVTTKVTP